MTQLVAFRDAVEKSPYSKGGFASLMGVGQATLSRYFSGEIAMPDSRKRKAAALLGMTVGSLFFGEGADCVGSKGRAS